MLAGMKGAPTTASTRQEPWMTAGNLSADVHETHTGLVALIGDKAFKAKKPVVTDFLDFSTAELRENACRREVFLNRRLAPESYFGVGYFSAPQGGPAEPVIVMRRYPDTARLSALVKGGGPVADDLVAIAAELARFHQGAVRGQDIDSQATEAALSARWHENLTELERYVDAVIPGEPLREISRLATRFMAGRAELFAQRIHDRRVVDGHGDLLSEDIFCLPDGPALLDCLEFDDQLRYVDGIDDAAFLAMDLEFLGRKDLADFFLDEYSRLANDTAPKSLRDFCVAYRAVVRAKVDCIRVAQGHPAAGLDARRHADIALKHLRACAIRLIVIGGGPGTGKTTMARGLAQQIGAQVISTDEVRRELQSSGVITGPAGELDAGLYSPQNVSIVYDEVLRRARALLCTGSPVILDGTWRDAKQRSRARGLANQTFSPIVEFVCTLPLGEAMERIATRGPSASDATPQIATSLGEQDLELDTFAIDTARPLTESVAEAQRICCLTI